MCQTPLVRSEILIFCDSVAPSGLSNRHRSTAVDAALGYHYNHNFDMHADFLLHTNVLTSTMNGTLPLYVGLGARVLAGDDTQFGLRFPIGVSYLIASKRLEIFAELAPILDVSNIGGDIDGVVGLRLYAF